MTYLFVVFCPVRALRIPGTIKEAFADLTGAGRTPHARPLAPALRAKGGRKPINAKCEAVHSLPTFRDRIGNADGTVGELERPISGEIRTFAIITTDANELVAEIHDRMPLILALAQ